MDNCKCTWHIKKQRQIRHLGHSYKLRWSAEVDAAMNGGGAVATAALFCKILCDRLSSIAGRLKGTDYPLFPSIMRYGGCVKSAAEERIASSRL